MRELDCDFCGTRAAGAFEVVPAELDPTPEEQVRVVLCENCRDTLDAVTAPLLARLGVGDGGTPSAARDPAQSTLQSGTDDGDDGDDGDPDGTGPEDGAQASARSENPVSPADDAVIIDAGGPRARPNGDESDDRDADTMDASDVAAVRKATAAEQDPSPDESGDDGEDDADDGAEGEDAADAGTDAEDGGSDGEDGGSGGGAGGEPAEFRTVMRLLNNREFPVDRAEITDLASGAYELEVSEVDEIIDYAIERDILAEDGGELTKA
ncbi:hypothetical protein [Halorarum halobium]|uniref:hypothetical protein n=1 Tax=Halorarum halobium TaxID=3075121 RepID=UPI0028AC996D|nr:hypothetical protein [Halobaculum sp. XH14]